jgi:Fe2+ or Zn2+ uptake regulation protein
VPATNSIVSALDSAGYRLTAPRLAVADLIAAYDGHFTASDLAADGYRRTMRATIPRE